MHQFVIRQARISDIDEILALARHLDSVNLPNDRSILEMILKKSEASFEGSIQNHFDCEYIFALIDRHTNRVIGTSQIIPQHGTRENPYVFFEISDIEKHSATLDKRISQQALTLRFDENGPTEIGGIAVEPSYRQHPEKLGKQLSFVRFLFMGAHKHLFKNTVVAELMPSLLPSKTSEFWEILGKHFTGMPYREACFLSRTNTLFVWELFPHEPIYTCILNRSVQQSLGMVGPNGIAAEHVLKSVGFQFKHQIDVFDAGPHLKTDINSISLVHNIQTKHISQTDNSKLTNMGFILYSNAHFEPHVRFIRTSCAIEEDEVLLSADSIEALEAQAGNVVHVFIEPRQTPLNP